MTFHILDQRLEFLLRANRYPERAQQRHSGIVR